MNSHGPLDPDDLRRALPPCTRLASLTHANYVVGTIRPIDEMARIALDRGMPLPVDALPLAGKIPWRVEELGADLLSLSAHKLDGPRGAGTL